MAADTSGSWLTLAADFEAPEGAKSTRISFVVDSGGASDFDVFFDVLFFGDIGLVFADGFESGNLTAWSSHVP